MKQGSQLRKETMIEVHKRQLEWWKSKLGLSYYGVAWIAFFKGILLDCSFITFFITY